MSSATMSGTTARAAARFGNRIAIRMDGGTCASFEDIDRRASRFAGGLAARGIGRGDRVMIHLPNGIDWVVAYHGAARLGAVVVPANVLLTPAEVGYIAEDAAVSAILCDAARLEAITASLGDGAARPLLITTGSGHQEAIDFAEVACAPALDICEVRPDDLFTIAYTSGTTGRPKGAMTSHRAVHDSTAMTATIHVRHSGDRILTALPFSHVYGNVVMNATFAAGYELIVMERFDPGRALELITEHRITLFEGVPTMYYQILQHPGLEEATLGSLVRCTVGGQTMPTSSILEVERRFGCPVLELWGMTELAGPATSHSPYWPPHHGSIGLPFPGMEIRIADLENAANPAPPGSAGELQIRGTLATQGYWRNEPATVAAIDDEGWFSTGDIARQDKDGYLYIVDRRKDMIITAGYNVYPAELEQVIAMHPAVAMAAVAGIPDPEKGELAKAFIVLRPGQSCSDEEMLAHCRQHLASYKVPRVISYVDDLPKTSTGKIMRRSLASFEP